MQRAAQLRELAALHGAWTLRHADTTPVPPGHGEDVAVHHLDAASPPDAEAEFQRAALVIITKE